MTTDEAQKINPENLPKFSVFAREQLPMPGVKKRLDEILNKEIAILDYRIRRSTKRDGTECLQMQFLLDGQLCVLFTGSSVLLNQIKESAENIPFSCTIVKSDRYYSFS